MGCAGGSRVLRVAKRLPRTRVPPAEKLDSPRATPGEPFLLPVSRTGETRRRLPGKGPIRGFWGLSSSGVPTDHANAQKPLDGFRAADFGEAGTCLETPPQAALPAL